jgi:translation initiation factor IF-3
VPVVARRLHEESHISEPRINERIRVSEVRLVGPNGEQVGIVRVEDALRLAQEADLDLVEVAPDARPPVCKLMDYGKFKYEADMKAREARRNQANTVLKEIRFRLKIDPHDYGTKKGHVERFLKAGDKVKVMIMFRGREQSRPEMGVRLLQRLADDVAELGSIESMPRQDGRNMIMVLGPTKKKADVKNELRRKAQEAEAAKGESDADVAALEAVAPRPVPVESVSFESVPVAVEAEPVETAPVEAEPVEAEPVETAPVETSSVTTEQAEVAPAVPKPAAKPAAAKPAAATPAAGSAASPRPAVPRPASSAAAPKPAARSGSAAAVPKPSAAPKPTATPRPSAPRPAPRPGKPS